MSDTACVSAMSAAFLLSLRHHGCDHGVPADPTATRSSRPRPGFPDRDPADPTATWLTRRHLDQHNGILAVGFSTSLLTRRRPGCSDGEPATRFSRRDPVITTATRLSRRRPGWPVGISTSTTTSWLYDDFPTAIVSQTRWRSPGCVPAVPAVSRPCRQCPDRAIVSQTHWQSPGCADSILVCVLQMWHTVFCSQWKQKFSAGPLLQFFTPRSSRCYQSWSRAPIVTNLGWYGQSHTKSSI